MWDFKQLGQETEELLLWLPPGIKLCTINTHSHTKRVNSHTVQQAGLSCEASHTHTHKCTHLKTHPQLPLDPFPNTPPLSLFIPRSGTPHPLEADQTTSALCHQIRHSHTVNQFVYETRGMQDKALLQAALCLYETVIRRLMTGSIHRRPFTVIDY